MKKLSFIVLFLCCFLFSANAFAEMILEYDGSVHNYTGSVYKLSVNGTVLENLPLEPIIFNDRALVPVREVFEALGAEVLYENETKTITVSYSGTAVKIQIDSTTAEIGEEKTEIPDGIAPKLIAKWGEPAKTMVPARFVSESVGLDVSFDMNLNMIAISEEGKPSINTITEIIEKEEDGVIKIGVVAQNDILSYTNPIVTSTGIVYVDINNVKFSINEINVLKYPAVHSVRLGIHEYGTRVAIDLDVKKIKDYTVNVSGNILIFTFTLVPEGDTGQIGVSDVWTDANLRPSVLSGGKKYVVIDAGHGGRDPGASTTFYMTHYEKNYTLLVATKIKNILEGYGVDVIMTRTGDTYPTLEDRCVIANNNGAAMFLSVHLNTTEAETTEACGMEIYYCEDNNSAEYGIASAEMASIILRHTIQKTGAASRGVKRGNLYVTKNTVMPANLIEIGFMNNPSEMAKLASDEYQNLIAEGIAEGIMEVYGKITLP